MPSRAVRFSADLTLFVSIACCVLACGCERRQPRLTAVKLDDPGTAYAENRDHLILALDFLDGFHEYNTSEIVPRITNHLQTWIADARAVDDWFSDPLYGRLAQRLGLPNDPATLSRLRFQTADLTMLREAMWLQEISRQVRARELSDQELSRWLEEQEPTIGIDGVRDLSYTIGLFDWVVRNIQIEPTPPQTNGSQVSARLSWEALLLGRGDAWVRGELFILLCRQARIQAFMLGIEEEQTNEPWAVGVWIGDLLYLFDPLMGLPIPAADDRGVVDLRSLRENPERLSQLDVEGSSYPVRPEDLDRLVAMLDGTVPYLSQRMRIVEDALPVEYRMVLTTSPSELAVQIRRELAVNVELWSMPYETIQFRARQIQEDIAAIRNIEIELSLFLEKTPLASARREHFRGRFANDPPKQGAKALYVECRIPDAAIDRLSVDSLRGMYGIPADADTQPQVFAQLLPAAKNRARLAKEYASYWLGLIAFEEGRPDVAIDYLRRRTLEAYPNGLWSAGAKYNLARSFEALARKTGNEGLYADAIALYEADQSPQAHGNKIRARRLQ